MIGAASAAVKLACWPGLGQDRDRRTWAELDCDLAMRQFGWLRTKLATACVAFAVPVLLPAPASAHAGEGGVVLLLPTGYAIVGGTLMVAATFILLSFIPNARVRRFSTAWLPLPVPADAGVALSAISFLLLALLVAAGFLGTRDPLENPLPLTVWTLWWAD